MATIDSARGGEFLTQKQVIESLYAVAMRRLRGQENESTLALMQAYRTAQDEIVGKLATYIPGTENWNLTQWQESGRLTSLLQSVNDILIELQQASVDEIGGGTAVQFIDAYDQTSWALDQATPPSVPVNYARPPEDAVKLLVNTPYKGAMFSQRIGLITDSMASDIRDELTQSLIQGEGIDLAAERVRKIIGIDNLKEPESYAARARVIARSEIMRAQNMAREFSYEQNKDLIQDDETIWVVSPDDRLCQWCFRREGLTDAEIQDSNPGDDPWENSTDVPLHPNCRCTKEPKLKSWSELIGLDMPEQLKDSDRGIRNADGSWEIAPVEKFDAWMERRAGQLTGGTEA